MHQLLEVEFLFEDLEESICGSKYTY